ncbi:MAG: translation initiation factor IF-2 N-terminal domain-containing protein [Candidatus Obscuribacter sp.]|nr:translation initiation factor IF-2 N-terminal domain-containing protein [Candidatus Obscuribacter sp.]
MPPRKKVRIANPLTANELAALLEVSATVVIKSLFMKGIMRTVHQIVELETARALAVEMGYELSDDEDP